MTQTWESNTYSGDHIIATDMQNIEYNLLTLQSCFSGTSAPSNPVTGQIYFNTFYNTPRVKVAGESANWFGFMVGSDATQIYMYANDAPTGWVLVSGLGDRVLAVKGGSQAYNASGGTNVGTWTLSSSTSYDGAHQHRWLDAIDNTGPGNDDLENWTWNSGGSAISIWDSRGNSDYNKGFGVINDSSDPVLAVDAYTDEDGAHSHAYSQNTWRPAAALGIIVQPRFN
jgi:hypothetical protein